MDALVEVRNIRRAALEHAVRVHAILPFLGLRRFHPEVTLDPFSGGLAAKIMQTTPDSMFDEPLGPTHSNTMWNKKRRDMEDQANTLEETPELPLDSDSARVDLNNLVCGVCRAVHNLCKLRAMPARQPDKLHASGKETDEQ